MLDNRQAGPTALRMQIGARLRRLREEKGIGRVQAGAAIRGSASKMSRLELGGGLTVHREDASAGSCVQLEKSPTNPRGGPSDEHTFSLHLNR